MLYVCCFMAVVDYVGRANAVILLIFEIHNVYFRQVRIQLEFVLSSGPLPPVKT